MVAHSVTHCHLLAIYAHISSKQTADEQQLLHFVDSKSETERTMPLILCYKIVSWPRTNLVSLTSSPVGKMLTLFTIPSLFKSQDFLQIMVNQVRLQDAKKMNVLMTSSFQIPSISSRAFIIYSK